MARYSVTKSAGVRLGDKRAFSDDTGVYCYQRLCVGLSEVLFVLCAVRIGCVIRTYILFNLGAHTR